MKLITAQRLEEEKLAWEDVRIEYNPPRVIDGETHTYALQPQIIDAQGNVYHGIIREDGNVDAGCGYVRYDSVATFEGFQNAKPVGLSKRFGLYRKSRHYLYWNDETGQVFARQEHPNVSEQYIYSLDALDLLEWLGDIDNREEPVRYDDEPRALAIGIPIEIINTIERHLDGNAIDWVRCILAEALGDMELAGAACGKLDGTQALTPEQVRAALELIQKTRGRSVGVNDSVEKDLLATPKEILARITENSQRQPDEKSIASAEFAGAFIEPA